MIHVVLYEPEIPQNTGNIMRTCMAFRCVLHLIEPLGFQLNEKNLRRAGMDYVKELEYHIYSGWDEFMKANDKGSFYFVTRYGTRPPSAFDYAAEEKDIYLVFGKESTGIDKAILAGHMDRCMRIPMVPDARSLNLSNCVALCVFEVLRQKNYEGLSMTEVIKGADFLYRYRKEEKTDD